MGSSLFAHGCWMGLQQREEHLWVTCPPPGEHVPLRLMTKGYNGQTLIERVWTPLGDDLGEIVYCKAPVWAGLWGPDARFRFPAPLEPFTQQKGKRLEIHVRVVGPLECLLLLSIDRWAAQHAVAELPAVDEPQASLLARAARA